MTKYRKVYRDHEDPETGLRWYSDDYVKEPGSVMDLPGLLMRALLYGYLGFWAVWLSAVVIPEIFR